MATYEIRNLDTGETFMVNDARAIQIWGKAEWAEFLKMGGDGQYCLMDTVAESLEQGIDNA